MDVEETKIEENFEVKIAEIVELKKALQSKTEELEALNKHYVGLRAFTEHNKKVRTRLQKEGDLV